MTENEDDHTFEYIPFRCLTNATLERYGISTKIGPLGEPTSIGFPYSNGAFKVRKWGQKEFWSTGEISKAGLFGKDKFPAGSSKSITITEGEIDAASVYQILGYPAVSVQSASVAKRDCSLDWDYLNSFERIYLCLDADEAGARATRDIAGLFDFNKVYHVKLGGILKDANGYLQAGELDTFKRTWFNAKRFMPEGIVSSFSEIDGILDSVKTKHSEPLPFPSLQEMMGGLRTGEATLITALEGVGKTEFLRRIESHLIGNSDHKVGIIHIEEGKDRVIKGLAGHKLKQPVHTENPGVSLDEVKRAYRDLVRVDDRVHVYGHFGSDDPNTLLDTVRFLVAACGCRFIFLDHITMAVTGLDIEDERRALDFLSNRLAVMTNELDYSLIFVSHVNDDGLTRGSRNISKVAHTWIHLDRAIDADNEFTRNIARVTVRKNRPTGRTGPAGKLIFNPETFMLSEFNQGLPR